MKKRNPDTTLATRYRELEATCRLWIAANEAKAQRICELQREVLILRRRLARALPGQRRPATGLRAIATKHRHANP